MRSDAVQRLRWQGPIIPAPKLRRVSKLKTGETQLKTIKDKPVCFTHDGFAVAGAAGGNKVHVWDAEHGDELLYLDHGGERHEFEEPENYTKILQKVQKYTVWWCVACGTQRATKLTLLSK